MVGVRKGMPYESCDMIAKAVLSLIVTKNNTDDLMRISRPWVLNTLPKHDQNSMVILVETVLETPFRATLVQTDHQAGVGDTERC